MTTVAGASRYYIAASYTNQQGSGVSSAAPNILGADPENGALNPGGLLDVGRGITGDNGVGLTSSARSVNSSLISRSRTGFNQVFSLNGVEFGTIETLVQKIAAIRATIPESRLGESVRGDLFDGEL